MVAVFLSLSDHVVTAHSTQLKNGLPVVSLSRAPEGSTKELLLHRAASTEPGQEERLGWTLTQTALMLASPATMSRGTRKNVIL